MKIWRRLFSIIDRVYTWAWENTTHRPWTYPMREWLDANPTRHSIILPIGIAFLMSCSYMVSFLLSNHFWWWLLCSAIIAFLWVLLGHLEWDTAGKHIKTVADFAKPKRYRQSK